MPKIAFVVVVVVVVLLLTDGGVYMWTEGGVEVRACVAYIEIDV